MSNTNIVEQVFLQIVADVLECHPIETIAEYKDFKKYGFFDVIGADSVEVVEIVMKLEDIFDINITDEVTDKLMNMSYNEVLETIVSEGASKESMQRKAARDAAKARADKKQTQEKIKPVAEKKQAQEEIKPVAEKKQAQEEIKTVADKKQTQEGIKPVADKKQPQEIEFKNILQQAENLVAAIKSFETAQNVAMVKSEKQNKPVTVLRTMKDGKPYCELLGKKCNRPERPNNTGKDYCEFMNCIIYKNFQRLR